MEEIIGKWAFIIGLILAVIAGFIVVPYITLIFLVLGLIVGFLNVTDKESNAFLVATIALTVGASAAVSTLAATMGSYLTAILTNIVTFVVPAILVVAIKAVYGLAKSE